MIHIPPLIIPSTEGDLTIKRNVTFATDFESLKFTLYTDKTIVGHLTWLPLDLQLNEPTWEFTGELETADLDVIIPLVQKHVRKHHLGLYLKLGLPGVDVVCLNLARKYIR